MGGRSQWLENCISLNLHRHFLALNMLISRTFEVELWYGNHLVQLPWGLNWLNSKDSHHSKLWVITDEPETAAKHKFLEAVSKTEIADKKFVGPVCLWAMTIGAGPDKNPNELTASFNRETDVENTLLNPSLVTILGDALFFLSSIETRNQTVNANFFNTTLEYELYPGESYTKWTEWDEFNSNSYISGLLKSLGQTPPPPGAYVPGYTKPLPYFVFMMSFSSTKELKKVWKGYFSGF